MWIYLGFDAQKTFVSLVHKHFLLYLLKVFACEVFLVGRQRSKCAFLAIISNMLQIFRDDIGILPNLVPALVHSFPGVDLDRLEAAIPLAVLL